MFDPFQTGEAIVITADERVLSGVVVMASGNGRSLFVQFDGMIGGEAGAMALLLGDDGVFRSVFTGMAVTIAKEGRGMTHVRREV
jgi:hypothetical protein